MQDAKAIVRRFLLDTIVMAGDVEIGDETSFMDDHILDSTGFIELITFVEETFGVTVDDEEMLPENFDSLRNIDDYLARKRAARAVA
jgi:acyl carrier protein